MLTISLAEQLVGEALPILKQQMDLPDDVPSFIRKDQFAPCVHGWAGWSKRIHIQIPIRENLCPKCVPLAATFLSIYCHEAVHIEQMHQGRLLDNPNKDQSLPCGAGYGNMLWLGVPFKNTSEGKQWINRFVWGDDHYFKLPWEAEAKSRQDILARSVLPHIDRQKYFLEEYVDRHK